MQCFQKDPNLRVSARKLLRHSWIVSVLRKGAPVAKAPSNFDEAVEEVKQWNKALELSDSPLRASIGSDGGAPPTAEMAMARNSANPEHPRQRVVTSIRSPVSNTKAAAMADAFRSPELAGKVPPCSALSGQGIFTPHSATTLTRNIRCR